NSRVGATFRANKAEPKKDLLCFRFCHNRLMAYRLSDDATPGGAERELRRPGVIKDRLGRRSARAGRGARVFRFAVDGTAPCVIGSNGGSARAEISAPGSLGGS